MAAGDIQQLRKKLKSAEDQVRALELDQKSVLERKRLDEEQIKMLERSGLRFLWFLQNSFCL